MASILIICLQAESRRLDMCTKNVQNVQKMKSTLILMKFSMMVGPTKGMIYQKKNLGKCQKQRSYGQKIGKKFRLTVHFWVL